MTVNWNLNKIYTKTGEIDGRCQQARHWAKIDAAIDAKNEQDQIAQQAIIEDWRNSDPVDRAAERLSNSHRYRLAEYSMRTLPSEVDYYTNSEGTLTTWSCDPTNTPISSDELSRLNNSNRDFLGKLLRKGIIK